MKLNEYQELAFRTSGTGDYEKKLAVSALGIAGEAGEVADLIKKYVGHGHPLDVPKITKELGDVLWYVSDIAALIGVSLEKVATTNIEKLKKRYPNGFSERDSINRTD